VVQSPVLDYTWAGGTTLTFTSPPPLGARILARYIQALPHGSTDSSTTAFLQSGSGAVSRNVQAKLREARARQNTITTRLEAANNRIRVREAYAGTRVDEAFARFDMLDRRVDLAEGRADALGLGAAPKSLEEEIAELKSNEKVDAELEALKAAVKKG
jgi:hypothetical protein